jgi:hypothetical protein
MSQSSPAVLLLDDGELDALADLMTRSGIAFERMRGGAVPDDLGPPDSLLVTTPRHAAKVRRGSPPGARPGRPVRIIAVEEDSPSMRRMLRNMGFQMLVRQPAHPEVWRLLIQRALYQGEERRQELRLPVGSEVSLETGAGHALLVDISNRGCHLVTEESLEVDGRVRFPLASGSGRDEFMELSGRVVRSSEWTVRSDGGMLHSSAVLFDADLDDAVRMQLTRLINSRITGSAPVPCGAVDVAPLPSAESPVLPGLRLDDETDPPVPTDLEVDYRVEAQSGDESAADRRQTTRGDFPQSVVVMGDPHAHVLIGRDLSSGGMRVECLPGLALGDHLKLALHGPSEAEPIEVAAEVVRDDGEEGLALRFLDLSAETSRSLEKIVACLPAVESLEDEEVDGVGTILSEVLPS